MQRRTFEPALSVLPVGSLAEALAIDTVPANNELEQSAGSLSSID